MFQPRHRVHLSLQLHVESVLLSDYNQWDIKQFYHTLLHYRMKKQESKEADVLSQKTSASLAVWDFPIEGIAIVPPGFKTRQD